MAAARGERGAPQAAGGGPDRTAQKL